MNGPFQIGQVEGYERLPSGWRVTLDNGAEAMLAPDNPIPDHFRGNRFSLGLFDRNYGVGLTRDGSGAARWYPALLCAQLLCASVMSGGRIIGLDRWTQPDSAADEPGASPFLHEGAISMGLAGGSAALFHLFPDTADYAASASAIRTALARMLRAARERRFAEHQGPLPGQDAAITLARIDFAYTFDRTILHVRKSKCPDQELAAHRRQEDSPWKN